MNPAPIAAASADAVHRIHPGHHRAAIDDHLVEQQPRRPLTEHHGSLTGHVAEPVGRADDTGQRLSNDRVDVGKLRRHGEQLTLRGDDVLAQPVLILHPADHPLTHLHSIAGAVHDIADDLVQGSEPGGGRSGRHQAASLRKVAAANAADPQSDDHVAVDQVGRGRSGHRDPFERSGPVARYAHISLLLTGSAHQAGRLVVEGPAWDQVLHAGGVITSTQRLLQVELVGRLDLRRGRARCPGQACRGP